MKKRLIISSVLIIVISTSALFIKQRRSEAVIPFAGYVAISALIHFAVGAYIYLQSQSGGNDEAHKITVIDENNGAITLDMVGEVEVVSNANVPIYDIPATNPQPCYSPYQVNFDPNDPANEASRRQLAITQGCINVANSNPVDYCTIEMWPSFPTLHYWVVKAYQNDCPSGNPLTFDNYSYDPNGGSMGGSYTANLGGENVEMYEFIEDVPLLPTCFDGIQNQDETGIDCGGVCEFNFGFVCPPTETCFDGIMNQDETGVDFGGVCGTGDPVTPPPDPNTFVDDNTDGIDDITGLTNTGSVPIAVPGTSDSSTYDTSLPGDVSEFGETDWGTLITDFVSQNPLVLLATNSSINTSNESCLLTFSLWGKAMEIDFCSIEWMVNLFGTFVLGLMTIRSIFIAMGI